MSETEVDPLFIEAAAAGLAAHLKENPNSIPFWFPQGIEDGLPPSGDTADLSNGGQLHGGRIIHREEDLEEDRF